MIWLEFFGNIHRFLCVFNHPKVLNFLSHTSHVKASWNRCLCAIKRLLFLNNLWQILHVKISWAFCLCMLIILSLLLVFLHKQVKIPCIRFLWEINRCSVVYDLLQILQVNVITKLGTIITKLFYRSLNYWQRITLSYICWLTKKV